MSIERRPGIVLGVARWNNLDAASERAAGRPLPVRDVTGNLLDSCKNKFDNLANQVYQRRVF